MILTNNKFEVTIELMEDNNMTRGSQFGIPIDPHNPSKGLCWKDLIEFTDDDFDKVENYFIVKLELK